MRYPEDQRERYNKAKRDKYAERKAALVCTECKIPLTDDDETGRCELCREQNNARTGVYRRTPKGREKSRRAMRDRRKAREKADQCIRCRLPRDQWPDNEGRGPKVKTCLPCQRKLHARNVKWRERKAAGLVPTKRQRWEARQTKVGALRSTYISRSAKGYRPFDELTVRERLLRVMSTLGEWATTAEILDAANVPEHDECGDNRERGAFTVLLTRLARTTNLIERRRVRFGVMAAYEYRLAVDVQAARKAA